MLIVMTCILLVDHTSLCFYISYRYTFLKLDIYSNMIIFYIFKLLVYKYIYSMSHLYNTNRPEQRW